MDILMQDNSISLSALTRLVRDPHTMMHKIMDLILIDFCSLLDVINYKFGDLSNIEK